MCYIQTFYFERDRKLLSLVPSHPLPSCLFPLFFLPTCRVVRSLLWQSLMDGLQVYSTIVCETTEGSEDQHSRVLASQAGKCEMRLLYYNSLIFKINPLSFKIKYSLIAPLHNLCIKFGGNFVITLKPHSLSTTEYSKVGLHLLVMTKCSAHICCPTCQSWHIAELSCL